MTHFKVRETCYRQCVMFDHIPVVFGMPAVLVLGWQHCKQFSLRNEVRSPTDIVQGVKLKEVSDRSIYEKAHRLYYKVVFTRLLAVERTTSLLNSDI